ncbi:MAG: thioesterase family protein [Polyangiales bacterium]
MSMPEPALAPTFRRHDDAFVPLAPARSGWDPGLCNGSAAAGLLARLLEGALRRPGFQVARLTIDLLKPIPFDALTGRAHVQREGGRLRQGEAELRCGDAVVARASGLFLAGSDAAGSVHGPAPFPPPGEAESSGMFRASKDPGRQPSFEYFCDLRWVTARDAAQPALWVTPPAVFVEGEPCSDLVRCVGAADLMAGLAELSRRHRAPESPVAINADLNLTFSGEPRGSAFGLRLTHLAAKAGVGLAHAELFDEGGFRGTVAQCRVGNTPKSRTP